MSFTRNNAHAYVWLIVVLNYFRSNKQILYFISAYCRANEGNSEADALETGSFTTKIHQTYKLMFIKVQNYKIINPLIYVVLYCRQDWIWA
jgi:hypothetical protein